MARSLSPTITLAPCIGSLMKAPRRPNDRPCPVEPENRTKMFHVKHFGTIWTGKDSRAHTADGFQQSTIARKIRLFERALDWGGSLLTRDAATGKKSVHVTSGPGRAAGPHA